MRPRNEKQCEVTLLRKSVGAELKNPSQISEQLFCRLDQHRMQHIYFLIKQNYYFVFVFEGAQCFTTTAHHIWSRIRSILHTITALCFLQTFCLQFELNTDKDASSGLNKCMSYASLHLSLQVNQEFSRL